MIDRGDVVAYDQPIGRKVNAFAAVQAVLAQTTVIEPIAAGRSSGVSLVAISPNPFGPTTSVRFALSRPGIVEISIFDLAGRRVRTLEHRGLPAGAHESVWDGTGANGKPVSSGVYLVRAESAGESATGKVVLRR
jgi:flagellar hook assembly protein FlgD